MKSTSSKLGISPRGTPRRVTPTLSRPTLHFPTKSLALKIAPLVVCLLVTLTDTGLAQDVRVVKQTLVTGTIASVKPGEISLKHKDGKVKTYKIQDKDERAITLGGQVIRVPATIAVKGSIPVKLVERGMIVKFMGRTNVYGKCDGQLKSIEVYSGDASDNLQVDFLERPEGRDAAQVDVIGRVVNLSGNKLQLQVPKAKWSKKERIIFEVADDCVLEITDDDLNRVKPGDLATRVAVLELSTGESAIREIDIYLAADRSAITTTFHEKLDQQFSHLSDEPSDPRELRSKHFVLYTDVSERNANILLAKLETMYGLVSSYYSARPAKPIECYVVRDLNKWPAGQFEPIVAAKILEPSGVTKSRTSARGNTEAIVYSCDKHSVVQHEAVHAFCALTFGSPGPVWYAEGMAEMGMYWKPGQVAVDIDSVVIDYLTNAPPKKMADIVAAGQITGDSWQAYAWRWALCHLLASNSNYARRFKKLGMNIMAKKPDSFDNAFGKVADKISFEYDQFVQNFGNGYRVDLCQWDWKTSCSNLSSDGRLKQTVKADRGWQATKLKTREGVSYDFVTQGKWKVQSKGKDITPDGNATGTGKLVGVIFRDFELGEPFDMGQRGSFVAQEEGQLYVRCQDSWTELADNKGQATLFLRRSPKKESGKKN